MTPEVRRLFDDLVALPPDQQQAALDRRAPNADVRQEVEDLLAADALTDGMIEGPIRRTAGDLADSSGQMRLGVWRTLGLLGQGGMGVVYKAERCDGVVEQIAAIKLLYRGLETDHLLDRFQRERSILARLSHPNIARFLDAGATAEGLPWFAMEYVDGVALDRYCEAHKLAPAARVRLMLEVCAAVQHAHRHLVVHRDIKPDNILVTGEGVPVLLDFGIAQVLGESGARVTRAMTPEYASPEQLRGEPATTSTDVYLLAAVLSKLLDATPPKGDLGNILAKAMRDDPSRRYSTVAEFAADLAAWLGGLPVSATPDSFVYRTGRFVSRHRWPVAIAAIAFLATAASAIVAVQQARTAQRRFRDVRALANVFLFDFEASIHNLPGTLKARELVVQTARKYLDTLSVEDAGDPVLKRELAEAYLKLARIQGGQGASSNGRLDDSIASYRKSLSLRRELGDNQSKNPELRRPFILTLGNLLASLTQAQRSAEAVPVSKEEVENADAFAREVPGSRDAARAVFLAHHSRALLCMELGDAACALESGNKSLTPVRDWGLKHSGDRRIELDTALAEHYVAQANVVYGKYREARVVGRSMATRMERIEKQWPPTPESRRLSFAAWSVLGQALSGSSPGLPAESDEAIAALRRGLTVANETRGKDRGNFLATQDVMLAQSRLGEVLAAARPAEAVTFLEPVRSEMVAYTEVHPTDFNVLKSLTDVHNDLGLALRTLHRADAALREHLAALKIADAILKDSPSDGISRKARAISLIRAAAAESDLGRSPQALARLDQARQLLAETAKSAPADASVGELVAEAEQVRAEAAKKVR